MSQYQNKIIYLNLKFKTYRTIEPIYLNLLFKIVKKKDLIFFFCISDIFISMQLLIKLSQITLAVMKNFVEGFINNFAQSLSENMKVLKFIKKI